MSSTEQKVTITWCWEDIESFKPDWTPERC